MKKYVISTVLVMAGFLTMSAQSTPRVDVKQRNQTVRIAQGVKSGELTRWETANLRQDRRQLRKMERRAKADGVVTRGERVRLNRKANSNSRQIARKKNNLRDWN